MVLPLLIIGGLILLLLPQLTSFIQSLRNNTNTKQEESELVKTVDSVLGPQQVQDSTTLTTTGQTLVNNLKSNLTLTPLPNDPVFGPDGFFANLGNSISDVFSSKKKEVVE